MSKALLIIDMQKGSFIPSRPRFRRKQVCGTLNKIAKIFREKSYPVIHVQHDGSKENCFLPGSFEWEIIDDIDVEESDMLLSKSANSAFYESNLLDLLKQKNVDDLYIGGCATDFCVNASIQSALNLDFKVNVIKDGHTTSDRHNLSGEEVVKLFNYIWSNLTPTCGSVNLLEKDAIIEELK